MSRDIFHAGAGMGRRVEGRALVAKDGFSARYGQAISALVNVVTRDGGTKWGGHAAYESDRPFGDGLDYGLDRAVVSGDGPIAGGVTVLGAADFSARMDADPVNAPAPSNSRDPRHDEPWLLPHNSGQLINLAGKVTAPLGRTRTLRLLAAGDLPGDDLDAPAARIELVARGLEHRGAGPGQHDARALVQEAPRRRLADPASAARDDDHLAREAHRALLIL